MREGFLAVVEGGEEEGITVGGKNNVACTRAYGLDFLKGDGKTIDHGEIDVLGVAGGDDVGHDGITADVVKEQGFDVGLAFCKKVVKDYRPPLSDAFFFGFGIVVIVAFCDALAVADEPDFLVV